MDIMDTDNSSPKISLVEAMFMLMLVVPADLLEIFAAFAAAVPVLGKIVLVAAGFTDLLVLSVIQFWLIMKKAKWGWSLAGNLIECVPFLDVLPFRTACLIATIILTNNPKAKKIVSMVPAIGEAAAKKT